MDSKDIFLKYDVLIVGAGIGGLFTAYKLKELNKDISILIVDRGRELESRRCPAVNGRPCAHCSTCDITNGIAGAGAFSDAKFNLGTAYGGTLGEEIGNYRAMKYISEVDKVLEKFSDDYPDIFPSDQELKTYCLMNNLHLLDMDVRHLGTDRNVATMGRLVSYLRNMGVDILSEARCTCITRFANGQFSAMVVTKDEAPFSAKDVRCDKVVVATGRGGAEFVKDVCRYFDVETYVNSVDIGVRVEMDDNIWKRYSSRIYEPKIVVKTNTFEDKCRMFCFNQGGIVSAENNNGIITANGHSFADPEKKTDNCNFAILSSINFTEPFNQPTEYAENISKLANMIGNGNVIVQRFGDLIKGRRTTESRLAKNSVTPTLKATPGDISLVLPHRILTNIIETMYALDRVAPGTANDDTLLYGCESKYYSLKPKHNGNFEITNGLYLIGDGSGVSRGLSQAAAMGLYVAEDLLSKSVRNIKN